jgi:hypothetical protein
MTKNDDAWEKLFKKHDILSHISSEGKYIISANEIKKGKRAQING